MVTFAGAGPVETVVRLRPPPKDRLGDQTGPPAREPMPGCLFEPGGSTENRDGANQALADGTVYAPPGSPDVLSTDRLEIRGEVYNVIGKAQVWAGEGSVIQVRQIKG